MSLVKGTELGNEWEQKQEEKGVLVSVNVVGPRAGFSTGGGGGAKQKKKEQRGKGWFNKWKEKE